MGSRFLSRLHHATGGRRRRIESVGVGFALDVARVGLGVIISRMGRRRRAGIRRGDCDSRGSDAHEALCRQRETPA